MDIDFRNISSDQLNYDICIVGAGVAGAVAANELVEKFPKTRICVVESGDYSLSNEHNENLKNVGSTGLEIKHDSREFAVGGATNTWGGLTSIYTPIEVETRDYLELAGWPIKYDQLKSEYISVASKYNFINTIEMESPKDCFDSQFDKRAFVAFTTPVNYKTYINTEVVDLIYSAHVVNISSQSESVEYIELKNIKNIDKTVKLFAKRFIICTGGLETVKLLLNSLESNSLVLGDEQKYLGKYFMNHPKNKWGTVKILKKDFDLNKYMGEMQGDILSYWGLSLPSDLVKQKGLVNAYIRFDPIMPWSNDRLVYSFINLFKKSKSLLRCFYSMRKNDEVVVLDYGETGDKDYSSELERNNPLRSVLNLALYGFFRLTNIKPNVSFYNIRNYMEIEPRFENSIDLSSDLDVFGNKNINVSFFPSNRDKESLVALHEHLKRYIEKNSLGYVNSDLKNVVEWPIVSDASHHIGGAVMGESSKDSFVDQNLKVHSLKNLYISSSAVFPTSGGANPTWTIAAMSHWMANKMELEV